MAGRISAERLRIVEMVEAILCLQGPSKLASIILVCFFHWFLSSYFETFLLSTLCLDILNIINSRGSGLYQKQKIKNLPTNGKIMRFHFSKKDSSCNSSKMKSSLKKPFWKAHWHIWIKINETKFIVIMCLLQDSITLKTHNLQIAC